MSGPKTSPDVLEAAVKAGYFLALQHVDELLTRRIKTQDELMGKFNRIGSYLSLNQTAIRKDETLSLADKFEQHRERMARGNKLEAIK
jgi:hypothetical protein